MAQLVTGFTIRKLIEHLKSKEIDLAKALSDTPCLVFRPIAGNQSPIYNSDNLGRPISSVFKLSETDEMSSSESAAQQYLSANAVIAPLWKSGRNSFQGMISVGRSNNCDIRINSPQVSKIHALFTSDKTGWVITDNCSTNGTRVNNNLLKKEESFRLENNAEISLGELHAIFLTHEGLVALCNHVEEHSPE